VSGAKTIQDQAEENLTLKMFFELGEVVPEKECERLPSEYL